jgi:hypothetical protein
MTLNPVGVPTVDHEAAAELKDQAEAKFPMYYFGFS